MDKNETVLWLLFSNPHGQMENVEFQDGACYGDISEDISVKLTRYQPDDPNMQGIHIEAVSRHVGTIDAASITFPRLTDDSIQSFSPEKEDGKAWWCPRKTSPAEYEAVRKAAFEWMDALRQPLPEIPKAPPKQKRNIRSRDRAR